MNSEVKKIIQQTFTDPFKPIHQKGPDYIIPTNDFRTWLPDAATKIRTNEESEVNKPESVITIFRKTVDQYPYQNALMINRNGEWEKWTYRQYWEQVRIVAKGFIKLGLLPFHGVGILGYNAPEWFISHLATIFAGGFTAGIYTTNSPEACRHILNDCDANIVVVENETQLNKILQIRNNLPNLKVIVQYSGTPKHPDVFSWNDVFQIGLSVPDDILEKRIKGLAVNQCCFLIYTSGTTGNPKGVMISHDNVTWEMRFFLDNSVHASKGAGTCVSYLPLSHMAALAYDLYGTMHCGTTVYFAPADALKGSLVRTLVDAKPSGFVAVPRVYEKIYENIKNAERSMPFFKRYLFAWARKQAAKPNSEPILLSLANKLVFQKIKMMIGFENSKYLFTGGAPLATDIQQFFTELNIPLIEGYGLSESSGVHIINEMNNIKIGTVGNISSFPCNEVKIHNPDENGCGEILLRGRTICMGYIKLKEMTIETIDDEGWLHSGDIGAIDEFGYLRITGRIKELIITSGGENIPPIPIEDEIKNYLPILGNCMLIGDQKKYLTMLITLKTEVDDDSLLPTDILTKQVLTWCNEIGSSATTVTEIITSNDKKVESAIQQAFDKYNKEKSISNAQKIQKWTILPLDFCIPNGELGPTGKLRRPIVLKKYSMEINQMYSA